MLESLNDVRLLSIPSLTIRTQLTHLFAVSHPAVNKRVAKSNDICEASQAKQTQTKQTWMLLTLDAAGMAAFLALLPAVGHDQLWCLYVAQRMLHGTTLYGPELLESNPPLIMGILLIPAALSQFLHLPITILFKLGVLLLEAASAIISLRILRRIQPSLATNLWPLAFFFLAIFAVVPARDFGQRDHLLALLCLPYVLAAALDSESPSTAIHFNSQSLSRTLALLIGIAAGLGISLKPHHILIPIAIEAALHIKRRSVRTLLRPEPLAIAATCLAYLAAIHLFTPNYITQVVPLLRDVYWAIGHLTLPQLLLEAIQLHILAAITIALYFFGNRNSPLRPATVNLILAGIASTIAYYLQGTGWYYQQLPAISFFAAALALQLLPFATRPLPFWTPKAAAALSILALALTAYFSGYTLAHPTTFPSGLSNIPDPTFFANLPPNTPVAILTTVVDDSVPPIFTHHLLWAQRTNNLWALPPILRNETPNGQPPQHKIPPTRLDELDRQQHLWMVEDLNRWHPALILVLRCEDPTVQCQILEDRHDNLLAWFQRDPAFRAAFAQYHFLRTSGPYDAYVPN